jgi:O-antigen/teichoic acid export membrane protein
MITKNKLISLDSLLINFNKGNFGRDLLSLLSGNIFSQLLLLIATPFITRLYSPEEFGAMSFISSCIVILALLTCLRYDQAIVLPKNNNDAYQIVILSLVISLAMMAVFSIFLLICKEYVNMRVKYGALLWLIPIGALVTGWNNLLVSWNVRNKLFTAIAISQATMIIVSICIKAFFGIIGKPLSVWLILGNIFGMLFGAILLLCLNFNNFRTFKLTFSISQILYQAKKYKKFPLYGTINGFLESIAQHLPVFLLSYLFSPAIVGYYGLGSIVLRKPIQTIGISVSKVFYQRAASYNACEKSIEPILRKATLGLMIIAIIPFGVLFLFGDKIFSYIFGIEWEKAGIYCQILVPWLFLVFINKPSAQVVLVKQELKFVFYLMVFTIILRGTALLAGYYLYKSVITCLILFSAASAVTILINISYAFMLCNNNLNTYFLVLKRTFLKKY